MAWYPQNATGLNYTSLPAGPTPVGATITASASANTKGSYTQITASTAFTSNAANIVCMNTNSSVARLYLLDVATGAAASEVVQIPNINIESFTGALFGGGNYPFPWQVSSGTRIAMRCQCTTGSSALSVQTVLIAAGGVSGVTSFTNYGADTSASKGVTLDPGGTANTKGSYSQMTASTSAVTQWLLTNFTHANSTAAQVFWMTDLATGAAASEVVLIPDIVTGIGVATNSCLPVKTYQWLTFIAASTRIAARCSCTSNTANSRLTDLVLFATVAPSEPSGTGGGAWAFA